MSAPAGPTLRDIHLPPSPSWWPPAPGWWLLALIVAIAALSLFIYLRKRRRRQRYQRAVFADLERGIEQASGNPAKVAAALSQLLRRVALQRKPSAAAYFGDEWLAYLDAEAGTDEFSRGVGRALVEAPFRMRAEFDSAALCALVRRWLRIVLAEGPSHA